MSYLKGFFVVLFAIFALPVMGQVQVRDGCSVPDSVKWRGNVHQCADCSFRSRSPFDVRTDSQRCGESDTPSVAGPVDTDEYVSIFGLAPDPRRSNLRGMKLRMARMRYNERRANWGGVFLIGDSKAPFYVKDEGETLSASAASDPISETELKIPGLDLDGLSVYTKATQAKVNNIYKTWGLGEPVLWIEYNSYVRDHQTGGYKRGTAVKLALPDAPLPLFHDAWAYAAYTFPHQQVASAQVKLMQNCYFPKKIHTFIGQGIVGRYRARCK
ncbi:hypothetical protein LCGC14_1385960 [marine sediment metagenome]|uniref:Uncharacterized protein n=1 Tax=marine sediment metagenome TaxID=412755 RepID=A0A0F9K1K9_9ZZZZ